MTMDLGMFKFAEISKILFNILKNSNKEVKTVRAVKIVKASRRVVCLTMPL